LGDTNTVAAADDDVADDDDDGAGVGAGMISTTVS